MLSSLVKRGNIRLNLSLRLLAWIERTDGGVRFDIVPLRGGEPLCAQVASPFA